MRKEEIEQQLEVANILIEKHQEEIASLTADNDLKAAEVEQYKEAYKSLHAEKESYKVAVFRLHESNSAFLSVISKK